MHWLVSRPPALPANALEVCGLAWCHLLGGLLSLLSSAHRLHDFVNLGKELVVTIQHLEQQAVVHFQKHSRDFSGHGLDLTEGKMHCYFGEEPCTNHVFLR